MIRLLHSEADYDAALEEIERYFDDQIKLALGQTLDIWPASIADDPQSE